MLFVRDSMLIGLLGLSSGGYEFELTCLADIPAIREQVRNPGSTNTALRPSDRA
jgi:hypothetical protein